MKNIKNDKKLEKNMGVELNETQMDTVSGGVFGAGVETEVEIGDVNVEMGNIGLINKSNIEANIDMNTSGDKNTVQNYGGISIGGK